MKRTIERKELSRLASEAKATKGGLRIGQHVANTVLAGTALESCPRLFYCDDADFWGVAAEYFDIV